MTTVSMGLEVSIWTDASRAALVRQLLDLMGSRVKPICVGGPRQAEVDQLAKALDCETRDDLRQMLVERPATHVLLTSLRGVARRDLDGALKHGGRVLTLEPLEAGVEELPASSKSAKRPYGDAAGFVLQLGAFDRCAGWTGAADPFENVGAPGLIEYHSRGQPGEFSLFARLYEAWGILLRLVDTPDAISASLSGPLTETPGDLRACTGHMAVHARLPDGAAILMSVSDRASLRRRCLCLIGQRGELRIGEMDYHLYDPQGGLMEHQDHPSRPPSFAELLAADWQRLIDRGSPSPPLEDAPILACCQACLLSARTDVPESPRKILELHRRT